MIGPRYFLYIIAITCLCLIPAHIKADDSVLGQPKANRVDFSPKRHFNPMTLLPIEVNGRWGYADRAGDIVIEPRYEWVDYFYGPIYYSHHRDRRLYAWVARYRSQGKMGLLMFKQNKRRISDYMDGESLEAGKLSGVSPDRFHEEFVVLDRWVNDTLRYQLTRAIEYDRVGNTFDGALRMKDGLAAVQRGKLCGFIDKRTKVTIPFNYAEARSFHDGFAAVRLPASRGGAWGFIGPSDRIRFLDKSGEIEDLRSYHDRLAAVKTHGKWGFLDKQQQVQIKPIYDEVRDFFNDRAAVRRGEKWGYINTTGEELVWGFDGAWDFDIPSETGLDKDVSSSLETPLALIRLGDAYGYVDRSGNIALPAGYENARPFFRGAARVKCGNSFAYINQSGRLLWDPRRVSQFGVKGLRLAEPIEPIWPGLPQPDGAWGEPHPFEYDVEDHLPYTQPRNHVEWKNHQDNPQDTQQDPQQALQNHQQAPPDQQAQPAPTTPPDP